MNREKIGEALRQKRKAKKMKQKDVADLLDLSVATISAMERGQAVKLEKYEQYAVATGLGEQLFGIESEAVRKEKKVRQRLLEIEKIVNPDRALKQLNKLNEEMDTQNNSTLAPVIRYLFGRCYFDKKIFDKAQNYFEETIDLIDEIPDLENTNIKSCCLNELGRIAFFRSDFQQALNYTEEGLRVFNLDGERVYWWYSLLLNRAIYLDEMNLLEKALHAIQELEEAVSSVNESGNMPQTVRTSIIIRMYSTYANIANKMNMLEQALEYAQKGIEIAWLNRDYNRLFTLWTTVGIIYFKQGDFHKAENYYNMALDVENYVDSRRLPYNYTNLGLLLIQQQKLREAKELIGKSIEISKKTGNKLAYTESLMTMGKWYMEQNLFLDAIRLYKQARELALNHFFLSQEFDTIADLCACYESLNDKEEFRKYLEEFYRVYRKKQAKEGGYKNDENNRSWRS